jgi:hypothetical protein
MSEDKQPEEVPEEVNETELTDRVGQLLEAEAENLNAPVRAQVNQARQAALDEMPAAKARLFSLAGINWGPVSAVTLAICIVVTIWVFDLSLLDPAAEQAVVSADEVLTPEDIELPLNDGGLEMIDEQDFYAWLDLELSSVAEGMLPEQRQRARERLQNMDPERREKMRERWEGMSPEDRAAAREHMQERHQKRLPPAQDSAGE